MKIVFRCFLYGLIILTTSPATAQNFDINAYKQFLATHQNLTTTQLLQMHNAGEFNAKAYSYLQNVLYLDTVVSRLQLTQYELSLINKHGFMVSERLKQPSFGHAFLDIWHKDLPVFISTDAILHALHMSYDKILMDVELQILIPKLQELLTKLHSKISILASQYPSAEMRTMLKDVDVYLTVARRFFLPAVLPYFIENRAVVNEIMNLIQLEQPAQYPLFASVNRKIDFSQFKVRGHYTIQQYPDLAKYFKSMIWLGRTEIYLLPPRSSDLPPTPEDIKRQTIDAVLILELAKISNALPLLDEIDSIIKFFVGESDNVTLPNIQELVTAANIVRADELLNNAKLQKFQDTLKTKSYAFQRILSQILYSDPFQPDSIIPASAFLLLGQRFIVDSYVFSQVVYDRIKFNNEKIRRMLPSPLDALFALGNDAAAQLLKPELDRYKYGTNLAALRYLIDSYGSDFWSVSLYNLW
ncbi:MAG: DUF3160 domain-containing protein, partial [Ignavibacteria bacterium]|nr:DUF3160 domain-containing protein [Ignavibacteria bacterium]